MKLFSWAHRKLHQNPIQERKQQNAHADVITLASPIEPLPSHGSRFDTKRKEKCSKAMRLVTDSSQVEQYLRDPKLPNDKVQAVSALRDPINRGLLTIGTLGARDLRGEERREMQKDNAGSDPDVSPGDLLKLQEELQRILYTTARGRFQNYLQNASENEELKTDKYDGNEYEQADKKVFPLQKFLEIPLEVPVHVVNKKKHVLVQGLSNFLSCTALIPEKLLHHKAKETAKSIRISPFFLEKLLKFKNTGPGHLHYRSKVDKFLQIFRKIAAASQHRNKDDDDKVDYKEADERIMKAARGRGGERCILGRKAEKREENGVTQYQLMENLVAQGCADVEVEGAWLHTEDVRVLNTCKEYWIKTDDEYLVLEL